MIKCYTRILMTATVEQPQYNGSPRHMSQAAIDNIAKCVTSKCWICSKYGSNGKQQAYNPSTRDKTLQQQITYMINSMSHIC